MTPSLLAIVANEARNRRRSAGRRHALAARSGGAGPKWPANESTQAS